MAKAKIKVEVDPHHWHEDVRPGSPQADTTSDGILCVPVVCCRCGAEQYATLGGPTDSCGPYKSGARVDVSEFVPMPRAAKRSRRRKA